MACRAGDRWLFLAAMSVLLGAGSDATAQVQTLDWNTSFDPADLGAFPTPSQVAATEGDTENVGVLQRPHPLYQQPGDHLGGFIVYPSLTLTAAYDDNIFVVQNGAVGDGILTVTPEVDIQSAWSRDLLWAFVKASEDVYATHSNQDATQALFGAGGRLDLGEANLSGGVKFGQYVLPRAWDNAGLVSVRPILYDFTGLYAEFLETFNRLKLSGRVDDHIYAYRNGLASDGLEVFEQGQNRNVAIFTGKAEYGVSPDTSLYVTGAFNSKRYDLAPTTGAQALNSQGYRIVAGSTFNLTDLVRGDVQLGYQDQQYVSPLFRPVRGLSATGRINWFVTPLTTVTFTGVRAVEDAGVINSAGYLTTTGGVQVDHELLRNLILGADFTGGRDQYEGIDRTDNHLAAGLSAKWLVNRRVGVTFTYAFTDQRSEGAASGPSFKDNRVTLSTALRF